MKTLISMPNSAPANASDEPHWPAPVSVTMLRDARLLVVERLRHRGVRLVAARRAHALVLVVDPRRASAAPSRGAARDTAASGATAGRRRAPAPGYRISRSVETSCTISAIGKSGARSSGPIGCKRAGMQRRRRRRSADRRRGCTSVRDARFVEHVLHDIRHHRPSLVCATQVGMPVALPPHVARPASFVP